MDFLFKTFKAELEEVIKNSSREEIWVSLDRIHKPDMDKFIALLVDKFPTFNEKLNERYFFDL